MNPDPLKPRVIEIDERADVAPPRSAPQGMPQVFMTERSERVVPTEPVALAPRSPARMPSRAIPIGLAGLGVFFAGWFVVDAVWWITAAFERSTALGAIAATAVAAGVTGAGAIIAREVTSLFRLKSVEAIHRRLSEDAGRMRPQDARQTIAEILDVVPKDREVEAAIEAFQRQDQIHHTAAQQIEILSRSVMAPLDRRAEAHVRTGVLRAFGITAISPTPLSDALFFLACGVRMVRGVAASYGHRPTAAATVHILRRLVYEAGKLGAIDIASTTLMQHLGGAAAERLATSAADALYASYRMARLGIIVMDLCRPIPFRDDDLPSVASLVGNVLRRRTEDRP
ncbi:MAG: putative rane protein [Alphaproteobacteria bacterium]|jgi:putative membrane protein|nr:putative rane protein [Alphaproteobacteria bacterium]